MPEICEQVTPAPALCEHEWGRAPSHYWTCVNCGAFVHTKEARDLPARGWEGMIYGGMPTARYTARQLATSANGNMPAKANGWEKVEVGP